MVSITASSLIYVDTNIFVYFIEETPRIYPMVKALFEQIDRAGARILTNEITIAECLYKPAQNKNKKLIAIYEKLFEKVGPVELYILDGSLAKRAAKIGAELGLKLIDSIHYFSALESGCDLFVTSDARFKSGPKLKVITISQK